MIPCSEAVRRMWDFLDRSLSAEDTAAVENHLAFCRRCCGELEFAKELRAFLRSHEVEEIPLDVKTRLEAFLEEL
jgi:anti-sigma factor (TIGR02949 family)